MSETTYLLVAFEGRQHREGYEIEFADDPLDLKTIVDQNVENGCYDDCRIYIACVGKVAEQIWSNEKDGDEFSVVTMLHGSDHINEDTVSICIVCPALFDAAANIEICPFCSNAIVRANAI